MNLQKSVKKYLFFTKDHDWIDFQGVTTCADIGSFTRIGVKEIQQVIFNESADFKNKGGSIATLRYNKYRIDTHIPVDGKLPVLNTNLISAEQ